MQRLRIGLIAPPWLPVPPPAYGGTENVLDLLACGLADAGHEVVLFASGDSTCPVEVRSALGSAPGVDAGGSSVEVHHVLSAYDALHDVDLVHDHTSVGPLIGRSFSRPVVTTNHNPFAPPFASVFREVAEEVPVVAISEDHARRAHGIPIAAVIHHGVDPARFAFGAGDGGYALFLGRMAPDKGPHRAIAIARAAGVPIVLAGKRQSAAEQAYFDSAIRPSLGPDVTYLGEVGAKEKVELLSRAVALVNPIEWDEPFGMVMVESLACGTPVLTLARGAAPEIVEDGVTGRVAVELDDLVLALSGASAFDRGRCREAVLGRFSAERMVRDHVALYWGLIDRAAMATRPSGALGRG